MPALSPPWACPSPAIGGTWDSHGPASPRETAPWGHTALSPAHGKDSCPAAQRDRQTSPRRRDISAVIIFSSLFGTKLGEAEAEISPPRCRHPCAPRQEWFPQPLSGTNCPSCLPGTQGRAKDHYPFQNETGEKIYNKSKAVIGFPRAGGALCCQPRKEPASGSSPSSTGTTGCYCLLSGRGEMCQRCYHFCGKGDESCGNSPPPVLPQPRGSAAGCCTLPAGATAGISRFTWFQTPEEPSPGQGWPHRFHFQPERLAKALRHPVPR